MENVSDEQLEAVSGGGGCFGGILKCPECGSNDVKTEVEEVDNPLHDRTKIKKFKCKKCGNKWEHMH